MTFVLQGHVKVFIHILIERYKYLVGDRYWLLVFRRYDGNYCAVARIFVWYQRFAERSSYRSDRNHSWFQISVLQLVCSKHLIFGLDTAVNKVMLGAC